MEAPCSSCCCWGSQIFRCWSGGSRGGPLVQDAVFGTCLHRFIHSLPNWGWRASLLPSRQKSVQATSEGLQRYICAGSSKEKVNEAALACKGRRSQPITSQEGCQNMLLKKKIQNPGELGPGAARNAIEGYKGLAYSRESG
eukprot:156806-Pelagomonas_calceolata.AAC.10